MRVERNQGDKAGSAARLTRSRDIDGRINIQVHSDGKKKESTRL